MKFRSKSADVEPEPAPSTVIGVGTSIRGTMMATGTLRIEGEFEGDILNCDRLEIGEHGIMRSDVEVKGAMIHGRVIGNVRALGVIEIKTGARVEGDMTAANVIIEPGAFFSGRCTMLEHGPESMEMNADMNRPREYARD